MGWENRRQFVNRGNRRHFVNRNEANANLAELQRVYPKVESAYVPSGAAPIGGIIAMIFGSALGGPIGGVVAGIVGTITVVLLVLLGMLIALIAFCGAVACITVVAEIVIALVGGFLTFGAVGFVPGWTTAFAGQFGKNRNAMLAGVISLPGTIVSFACLVALPQVALFFVEAPELETDDRTIAELVHLVADFDWPQLVVWAIGFLIAIAASYVGATGEVGAQKFCEPCEEHMDELSLHAMSYAHADAVFPHIHREDYASVARDLNQSSGSDLDPSLFACPTCMSGYLEARAWFIGEWQSGKNTDNLNRDWLCLSVRLSPDATRALRACERRPDA